MNIHVESTTRKKEAQTSFLNMVSHHQPVMTEGAIAAPPTKGFIFTDRDLLCMEHFAELPLDRCIRTNRPAQRVVDLDLRNPLLPKTWWWNSPRSIKVGLTSEQFTRHCAKSGIAKLGLILTPAALWLGFMVNVWFFMVAFFLFIAASLINTISPVYFRKTSAECTSICGVSPAFRAQFSPLKSDANDSSSEACQVASPHL